MKGAALGDMAGRRFGRLTVVEVCVYHSHANRGKTWRCVCTCGGWAVRTTYGLRVAIRLGHEPMCAKCVSKERSAYLARRRTQKFDRAPLMGRRKPENDYDGRRFFTDLCIVMDVLESLIDEFGPVDEDGFDNEDIEPTFFDQTNEERENR